MKKRVPIALILGCCLLICSFCLFAFAQIRIYRALVKAEDVVRKIEELLPKRIGGVAGSVSDSAMPVLEMGKEDYIALVEVPGFGVTLPVCSSWDVGKLSGSPCRFWGSVYDNSLVIGGSDQKGQFDFCDRINPGAVITVTALNGEEFKYQVARVDRAKHAKAEWLMEETYDLTLFVRAAYSLEYIAVRCSALY